MDEKELNSLWSSRLTTMETSVFYMAFLFNSAKLLQENLWPGFPCDHCQLDASL